MLMNSWQFHLSNWHGVVCPTWAISISFVYTGLLASSFPQSHKFNLTDCLKSSLLLQFYFLFVYMVDQTEMYPSRISPLKLFHRIKCNIGRLKGETLRGGGGGLVGSGNGSRFFVLLELQFFRGVSSSFKFLWICLKALKTYTKLQIFFSKFWQKNCCFIIRIQFLFNCFKPQTTLLQLHVKATEGGYLCSLTAAYVQWKGRLKVTFRFLSVT